MLVGAEHAWSPGRRALFRFGFVYLVLFYLPPPLAMLWDLVVPWVGAHVLGIEEPIATEFNGSGDRMFDWVQLFCVAVLALLGAAVWCIVSRRSRYDERLYAGLRIGMRYVLALAMLGYGFHKLIPLQFGEPGTWRLLQPYGESSPMGLLWTFMGYSPAYVMFTGFAEVLGGTLLLSRRTTTLGALVVMGVMANVVMLNFCYDVPVKIHSTHWLLLAVLLVLPDAHRIADTFVRNRPTSPVPLRRPFTSARRRRMWLVTKAVVVTLMFAASLGENLVAWTQSSESDVEPDIYEVESFARNGTVIPPLVTDSVCWRRLVVAPRGFIPMLMDGSKLKYRLERGEDGVTLTLTQMDGAPAGTLVETIVDGERATFTGTLDGATLDVRVRRIHAGDFLLMNRGFHWVNEAPFNR